MNEKKTYAKVAYRIVIEELVLQASIGIYPHERKKKQPLVISLKLDLEIEINATTQSQVSLDKVSLDKVSLDKVSLDKVSLEKQKFICYKTLCDELKEIVGLEHVPLLEDLGEMIAQACFARKQAQALWLSLKKTQASQGAEGVGIELSWQRLVKS